jgi:membrane protein DedA with SNARE-associated domain
MKPWLGWLALAFIALALVLVPFVLWQEQTSALSSQLLGAAPGRAALAVMVVLLLSADVLLPIPSSFVAAGAVALLGVGLGVCAIAAGMTAAAWLGYGLGLWGGKPLALRLAGPAELERAARLMSRYGGGVLLLCRGVPVLAEASTLLAGATRMRALHFGAVTGLGNLGLAAAYALTGLLQLSGVWALLAPLGLGVLVPGLALLALRLLAGGPG